MSLMVNEHQLDLLADAPVQKPLHRVRAALLNTAPTPVHQNDPATSWCASVAAALRSPSVRQRVLFALVDAGERGLSDYEAGQRLGILRTTAGKRRLELQRLGLVEDSGRRRETDTHVTAVVWIANAQARAVARQIAEEKAE